MKEKLKQLIQGICKTLNFDNLFSLRIEKIPTKEQIEKLDKTQIIEGGVFGGYKQVKSNIIKDIEEMKERWRDFLIENDSRLDFENSYSTTPTDPSQQKVINDLSKQINTIIHGPPGTGKSQTLTAIITNALFNRKKILVVCEKSTALEILNKNLENEGLDRFSAIISNVKLDRKRTVQKARNIIEDRNRTNTFYAYSNNSKEFEHQIKNYENLIKEENLKRSNVNRRVFGDETWKKIVTKFLKYNKNQVEEVEDKLKKRLPQTLFKYTRGEYHRLKQLIRDAKEFFFVSNDCFNYLNKDWFADEFYSKNKKEGLEAILNKIEEKIKHTEEKVLNSKQSCKNEVEKIKNDLKEKLDKIENLHLLKQENNFDIPDIYLTFLSLFSAKKKKIKKEKEKFIQGYFSLKETHPDLFVFEFLKDKKLSFKDFDSNINKYKDCLEKHLEHCFNLLETEDYFHKTFNQKNTIIKESKRILLEKYQTFKNFHLKDNLFNFKFVEDKEVSFKNIDININEYKDKFNLLKKEFTKLIEDETLEKFYNWKSFFYRDRQSIDKKILDILVTDFPNSKNEWLNICFSYYFNNVLIKQEKNVSPLLKDDDSLKNINKMKETITKEIKEQIKDIWMNEWTQHEEKQNLKRVFNLKGSKGSKRNSLKKIIHENFDLFTDFFPVLLLTPEVACTILPLQKNLFDLVIFDEASQLRIEDTYSSYIRGKHKIISGDEQQMPPSSYFSKEIELDEEKNDENEESTDSANEESLLSYVLNSNFIKNNAKNEKYLDYHYRSEHPALIEFSNKAFYKSRLIPMPPKNKCVPFTFIEVNGLYEKRINEDEAKEVVKQIENFLKNCNNENLPSIGIATFNINQRDIIKQMIREKLNSENLTKLEKSNYFVKNLENIQGDERDIIILSTTFGKNREGKFKQNFGGISHKNNGVRLLNVLITRAKKQVILLNSIPDDYYSKYQDELKILGKDNGRALLYAYISYVKAIHKNNDDKRELILKEIADNSVNSTSVNKSELTESPFEEEVLEYLLDEIEKDRIDLQYKVGGFRIDMVVKDKKGEPKIAVECDGAAYHSHELAVQKDMYRQKIIEEKTNLKFYRIYSTKWWYNTKKESQALIQFINKNCN